LRGFTRSGAAGRSSAMDSTRESQEELLELLWTAAEDRLTPLDRDRLPESLRCFLPQPLSDGGGNLADAVDGAIAKGWVEADPSSGRIQLSPEGRVRAEPIVRGHRLTESLLAGVLDVSEDAMESTACQMEHILSAEVMDAVCAFLGHPPVCPHDRMIPRGACCRQAPEALAPLIVPLAQLAAGEEGRVAFIHTERHDYRQRMSLLGLVPGQPLKLKQRLPTLVVEIGHTELALDREAGHEIFVRRRARAHP
jgi:DtxR family transcriptional regulator, Mn-dependent transcriptional regulator